MNKEAMHASCHLLLCLIRILFMYNIVSIVLININKLVYKCFFVNLELPYFGTSDEDMEDLDSDQVSPTVKGCLLLEFILQCLSKCFLYDKGGNFLTKERFDTLMQPLVDQVNQCSIERVYTCMHPTVV